MEVTESEKTAIEASDAAWKRPPQAFIDMWNKECQWGSTKNYFGKYNEETGYFELNEITDIAYDEALRIWARSGHMPLGGPLTDSNTCHYYKYSGTGYANYVAYTTCRTYFPIIVGYIYSCFNLSNLFSRNATVETVAFVGGYGVAAANYPRMTDMFMNCTSLRKIIGNLGYPYLSDATFQSCTNLEDVNIKMYVNPSTYGNLNLQWSPKLSDDSIWYFLKNTTLQDSSKSMTLTLHPDVYARVTDEMFELALSKNISIVTT